MADATRTSKPKLCVVCHQGPREVPDRDSMSPAKKVCRKCHGERLRGDLRKIMQEAKAEEEYLRSKETPLPTQEELEAAERKPVGIEKIQAVIDERVTRLAERIESEFSTDRSK